MAYKKVEGRGIKALAGTSDAAAWERKGKAEKQAQDEYESAVEGNSKTGMDPDAQKAASDAVNKAKNKVEKTFNAPARSFAKGGKVRGVGCATKGHGKAMKGC